MAAKLLLIALLVYCLGNFIVTLGWKCWVYGDLWIKAGACFAILAVFILLGLV
jgi:hypothetical protein